MVKYFRMTYLIICRVLQEGFCHYYFQIRKPKLEEVKSLAPNHIARGCDEVPSQAIM